MAVFLANLGFLLALADGYDRSETLQMILFFGAGVLWMAVLGSFSAFYLRFGSAYHVHLEADDRELRVLRRNEVERVFAWTDVANLRIEGCYEMHHALAPALSSGMPYLRLTMMDRQQAVYRVRFYAYGGDETRLIEPQLYSKLRAARGQR